MKIVIDSNVLLAGFGTHGLCEALLLICLRDHTVILSEHIMQEVRKHYRKKFKSDKDQTAMIIHTLRGNCRIIKSAPVPSSACPDPDDLPILGTAVAAKADCLVTGDQQLLALDNYQGIPILSPRAFYDHIRNSNEPRP